MADTVHTILYELTTEINDAQPDNGVTLQTFRNVVVSILPPETTLTFASSLAWNMDTDPTAYVVVTGTVTITLSNGANGQSYRIAIKQDGTGGRAITLAGCTALGTPTWATAANGMNLVTVHVVNGTRYVAVA